MSDRPPDEYFGPTDEDLAARNEAEAEAYKLRARVGALADAEDWAALDALLEDEAENIRRMSDALADDAYDPGDADNWKRTLSDVRDAPNATWLAAVAPPRPWPCPRWPRPSTTPPCWRTRPTR